MGIGDALPPGTVRPKQQGRGRVIDVLSEDGKTDAEFLKSVKEIEEQQQQAGWLLAKGALDKTDLLYLRDQEEQEREEELQRQEGEAVAFARARSASAAAAEATGVLPGSGGSGSLPPRIVKKGNGFTGSAKLKPLIKLKPTARAKPADGDSNGTGAAKRHKTESGVQPTADPTSATIAGDERPGNADCLGNSVQQQGEEATAGGGADTALAALLGDYGSSDADSDGDDGGGA